MPFLLDTDWIVHWLKGSKKIIHKVEECKEEGLNVSMISVAELYEGVYGSKNPEKDEQILKDFLNGVIVPEVTEDICRKFGQVRNNLRKRGELIGDFDILIASTALANNLTILTDNVKHYEKIEGLKFATS